MPSWKLHADIIELEMHGDKIDTGLLPGGQQEPAKAKDVKRPGIRTTEILSEFRIDCGSDRCGGSRNN